MPQNCILCQGSSLDTRFHARDLLIESKVTYPILECRDCGLLATMLPVGESGPTYPEGYYRPIARFSEHLSTGNREDRFAGRIETLRRLRTGRRILDVGCGDGAFVRRLRSEGWDVFGTEINHGNVIGLRENGSEVFEGELPSLNLPQGHFDIVSYYGSFEHVGQPIEELKDVRRILAKDGFLILTITNSGSLEAKLFGANWFGLEAPRHRFNYNRRSFEFLLRSAGLQCRELNIQRDSFITSYSLACSLGLRRRYSSLEKGLRLAIAPYQLISHRFKQGNILEVIATRAA